MELRPIEPPDESFVLRTAVVTNQLPLAGVETILARLNSERTAAETKKLQQKIGQSLLQRLPLHPSIQPSDYRGEIVQIGSQPDILEPGGEEPETIIYGLPSTDSKNGYNYWQITI